MRAFTFYNINNAAIGHCPLTKSTLKVKKKVYKSGRVECLVLVVSRMAVKYLIRTRIQDMY